MMIDTHKRSRLRFGAGASGGLSVRFTARLVHSTAAWKATVAARIKRERRIMVSAQESGTRWPGSCSTRKRSTHATSGRNSNWSYSRITISMVAIAQPMACRFFCSMASAM